MNYIGTKLTDFLNRGYSNLEWTGIKWSLVPLMMIILCYAIPDFRGAIIHENICSYIDCSYAIKLPYVGLAIAGGLGLMYLFEVAMLVCLPLLAVVSFYLFSYLEAVGLKGEYGLFSLTFLSQFIAYVRHKRNPATDLATERVHFPLQLIAAAYVLSAISKLWVSGLGWFNENAVNFAVQIYREYSSSYASSGQIAFEGLARDYSSFILQNVWLIKLLLGFCVLIEACAFILVTGKRNAFFYAFLLIGLHIGIYFTMHILLWTIIYPMLAFTINPIYHFMELLKWGKRKAIG